MAECTSGHFLGVLVLDSEELEILSEFLLGNCDWTHPKIRALAADVIG